MPRDHALRLAAFGALSVLLVGTMWVVPYLPTSDGPEWVFASHLENHYGDPGTIYRETFAPSLQFAERGFGLIYGPFEAWLGWQRGLQVALSLTVLLVAWGFVAVVHALERERWAVGFLGFPLALSWELYAGLWPFVVSTGIGLLMVAIAIRLQRPTWRQYAFLSFLLLLQAVAHVFGAVLTGAVLILLWLFRAERGRRLVELGHLVLAGLPSAGILVASAIVAHDRYERAGLINRFNRFSWHDTFAMLPRTVCPGPLGRALVVTLGVGIAAVIAAIRVGRSDATKADRALGVATVLLLLTAVFAPFQIPGWQSFSERFVPLGVSLAFAVLPIERLSARTRRAAPALLFVVASAWVGASYPFHRRLLDLCPSALAGLAAPLSITGQILPVNYRGTELPLYDSINAEIPVTMPLGHMATLYSVAHGGVSQYAFTGNPATTPFQPRTQHSTRPVPDFAHYTTAIATSEARGDRALRAEIDGELATGGMFYDEVMLFGAYPMDVAVWKERGYVADWEAGPTLVAHFEPCTIDFTVPPIAADPGPSFDVHVGSITIVSNARAPSALGEDGLAHFRLLPAPCGVVALRPHWEPGGGGVPHGCRNADDKGDLVATITRTGHRIACDAR